MDKTIARLKSRMPSKRRLMQVYTAVLYNAYVKGFATGKIYTGPLKNICVPGLNCYSCPGAVASCPLGALQNAVSASAKRPAFYAIGLLLLFGLLFGRVVCGFLCPFGLLQEMLHKIPVPKLKKNRVTRGLSFVKYGILAVFTIGIPALYAFRDAPLPAFCKYICPAGTLEGALGLMLHPENGEIRALAGPLFWWKLAVAMVMITGCMFIYRAFCRFICPLGAIYGLFAKIALLGVKLDREKCTACGACLQVCKTDIREVGDRECVQCGDCIAACPEQAISFRGGRILLHANETGIDKGGAADA